MASAADARVWLIKGSWRSSASTAEQLGNGSSPASALMISGYNSLTVRSRPAFLRLRAFNGCPRTNWPLAALLPRSSQYAVRFLVFVNARAMMLRAARVSTQPISRSRDVSLTRSNVRSPKYAGSARHRVPQNKLMRLIRTVALFCPMSEVENGWRTQFVSETVSASIMTTSRPDDRPQTLIAWSR